jgi:hypothetical protein
MEQECRRGLEGIMPLKDQRKMKQNWVRGSFQTILQSDICEKRREEEGLGVVRLTSQGSADKIDMEPQDNG